MQALKTPPELFWRTLKTRSEWPWRIFNAQISTRLIQTFHVWLPSDCRFAAKLGQNFLRNI
jgi:hypothetical protein